MPSKPDAAAVRAASVVCALQSRQCEDTLDTPGAAMVITDEYRPLVEAAEAMICCGCEVRIGWPKGGCGICNPLRAALRSVVEGK